MIRTLHYPIKTQQYIHEFLSKNRGKEFVALTRTRSQRESKEVTYKTGYYWILSNYFRTTNIVVQKLMNLIRNIFVGLQKILGIKRNYKMKLRKGSHWCIITDGFCKYLLKNKAYVLKAFRFTLCADEIWMPSILNSSPYKKNVFDLDNPGRSCMREIDWNRGNPYVWQLEDYDQLVHSDRLFARKMNSSSLPLIHKLKENHIV